MAKAEATVEELVSSIERGQLRLPEIQRRYAWLGCQVLIPIFYRRYLTGPILRWETNIEALS